MHVLVGGGGEGGRCEAQAECCSVGGRGLEVLGQQEQHNQPEGQGRQCGPRGGGAHARRRDRGAPVPAERRRGGGGPLRERREGWGSEEGAPRDRPGRVGGQQEPAAGGGVVEGACGPWWWWWW